MIKTQDVRSRLALALALALVAGTGLAGCGSKGLEGPCLEVEPTRVDFGSLEVGCSKSGEVRIRNVCDTDLRLDLRRGQPFVDDAFGFDLDRRWLGPDDAAIFSLQFAPPTAGELEARVVVETDDDLVDPIEVTITGRGVDANLAVDPAALDFRNVVVGTTRSVLVTLTNRSEVDTQIEFLRGNNLRLCSAGANDPAVFCVRLRDRGVDDGNRFELAAGESAELEVQFAPTVAGTRSDGNFVLREGCGPNGREVRVPLTGVAVEGGLRCRPPLIDFGQVNPRSASFETVTCENIANEPVTVTNWGLDPRSDPAFEVESARPQVLNEGDAFSIEVAFAPARLGNAFGTLVLETDANRPRVQVAVSGTGGGPDIRILAQELDFGRVALIAPSRRSLVITNVGFAPLQISEINVDTAGTGSFTSPDAFANVLQPGESQTVTIEFRPRQQGEIVSAVRVLSNDADMPVIEVVLRGRGLNLPPCNFSVAPDPLDFGVVTRTRTLRRAFEVRNRGSEVCLITGVRLLGGSDPAFSLPAGDLRSLQIPPGAAETVMVEFSPTAIGSFTGQVELSISSPTSPFNTVNLTGVGADGAVLVAPNELGFGVRGAGCASRERTVTVYNTGPAPVNISSIRLSTPVNPAFRLSNLPTPLPGAPLTLSPGQSTRFDVGFRAEAISAYASAVEIDATIGGRPVAYTVPLEGRVAVDATQVDNLEQLAKPKVDVLFVVDKAGSMGEELAALGSNAEAFLRFAEAQGLEYHLGVTTTATDDEAGRLTSATPGTLFESSVTGPRQNRIVTPQTPPNSWAALGANVSHRRGAGVADEAGLAAAELALSYPVAGGHNAGFLRPDAALSLIFVSDRPDRSSGSVDFYVDFFRSIKGSRNTNLFSASAITAPFPPGGCSGPSGTASSSGRFIDVARRTGGNFQSICTSDWGRSLEDLAPTAFGFRSRFFLSNRPAPGTLAVWIDGSDLPAQRAGGGDNWTFDPTTNSISFAPDTIPGPGAKIRVEYSTECL